MDERDRLRARFLGGMVGTGLGDAIGELAFSSRSEEALRERIAATERLTYTDDTAMAIGLAESIAQVGRVDPAHLGDVFRRNYEREPWRGYASGPPTVFRRVRRSDLSYEEAARELYGGEGSFGNGAAMRVAPVGLCFHADRQLYERVEASAKVTHAHPLGVDGAAVQARAVALAVEHDPDEPLPVDAFVGELIGFARTDEFRSRMETVGHYLNDDVEPAVVGRRLGSGVAAQESVPFAIYAFLRFPHSFEECLFCAALHSGDRDTVGAMACAISGAYLGIEALPADWRSRLEDGGRIEQLAVDLLDVCCSWE